MDVRTFPVLAADDQRLVDRLAVATSRPAARVLAYLLRRDADDDLASVASRTAIGIGTGEHEKSVARALEALRSADLVTKTTAKTAGSGRPPDRWAVRRPEAATVRTLYRHHARALLAQAERLEGELSAALPAESTAATGGTGSLAIGLNWEPNALHLPLFAARDALPDSPSLSFESYAGSRAVVAAVAAGDVDLGVAGAVTACRERRAGREIVPVAVIFQRSTVVLCALEGRFDEPFTSMAQLGGRRVGIPSGTETGLLARFLLEQAGLAEAVDIVDLAGEERTALVSGEVDAVTGMSPDPGRLEREGHTVEVVAMAEQYPVYGPALIVHRETLERRRPLLERALTAVMAGRASATGQPAVDAVATSAGETPAGVARTFERAVERFDAGETVRKRGWGWHTPDGWAGVRTALSGVASRP
ncbi:ABC transporter substrate-binding protein [Natrononativus amylolyticus]|uniref:ABC transporter substrate-binding protein n=1 Tax=Natrononativus amylolyticus TaxID=2963434 RepID=UPI0020CEA7C3|nr:ABC transporter substrate-binding protein [Natrononativus amylolyticus]